MATAENSQGFADSSIARIIALILAIAIAGLLFFNWSAEFGGLFSASKEPSQVSASQPAKEANPALDACLSQRVGDVDRMKSEGILSDAQYAKFKMRAQDLCVVQNPG
ncbi:MAG: hypothetical protein QM488_16325 [Rhizobiaceae bacterium]